MYTKRNVLLATAMLLSCSLGGRAFASLPHQQGGNVSQQASRRVSGVIHDSQGEPVIGATVKVKGKGATGTITDMEGRFTIEATPGDMLEISYVGYTPKEVKADANMNITLQEDNKELNEVVVVGYGTQKKVNLTGAVEQVTGDVFKDRPAANATQMLQGAIPNLQLDITDGKPTRGATYQVRGKASIGQGGSALVLIDGVEGDPSMLNPADIESVSVLKDAASAAIYGARGSFGVVLITTKQPEKQHTSITYSGNMAVQSPATLPDFVTDGYIWAEHFYKSYYGSRGSAPASINKTQWFTTDWLDKFKQLHDSGQPYPDTVVLPNGSYQYFASTDWMGELYKKSTIAQTHNVAVQGGNDKTTFLLSGRFYQYNGLFKYNTDKFRNYNLRAKNSLLLFPWLRIENNFEYGKFSYHNPENVGEGGGIWRNIEDEGHPTAPLYNPNGSLTYVAAYSLGDMVYGKNGRDLDNRQIRNTTSFVATFLNKALHVRGDFTFRSRDDETDRRRVPVPYEIYEGKTMWLGTQFNDYTVKTDRNNYMGTNLYGDYEHVWGKHYFKGMAGWNYEEQTYKSITTQRNGLLYPDAKNINMALGDGIITSGGYYKWKLCGGFFRINYGFSDRYLLEFNGRYDGSSKFPSHQQWGFFPSLSAGWRVTEEPWWTVDKSLMSNLKLRASYGSLGNGNVDPYAYLEIFKLQAQDRVINGAVNTYTSAPAVQPAGLTWERATTTDIGIDFTMFNDRLLFSADYYWRKTKDMYTVGKTLPQVFGADSPKGNYADMTTRGWELSITWADRFNLGGKPFNYRLHGTLADSYSVIDKYNNAEKNLSDYYVGERLGEIWGYVTEGLFKDQADINSSPSQLQLRSGQNNIWQPGDIKFKDLNGDKKITYGNNRAGDSGDRKVIGNALPRYTFSLNLSADWNNLYCSAFFQGVGKQNWYPSSESIFWGQYNRPYNQYPKWHVGNEWTENNPDAYLPRNVGYSALSRNAELQVAQTRYLQNVAYIRLKNLQIGYNLPKNIVGKAHMQRASVYISAENIWCYSPLYKRTHDIDVTNISGSDPDLTTINYGDGLNYPQMKSISLGLSVTF